MSTELNQKPFAGLENHNGGGEDDIYETAELASPNNGVDLDPEERARLVEEWKTELAKTEEEIQALRGVLTSKIHYAQTLKRKLGITPVQEMKTDFQHTLQTVRESDAVKKVGETFETISNTDAYQKTSAALKQAGHKTAEVSHKVTDNVKAKMSDLKNSQMYKSFEEKVSVGYTNMKARMTTSSTMSDIDGATTTTEGVATATRPSNFEVMLNEGEGGKGKSKSAPTTPSSNGGKMK